MVGGYYDWMHPPSQPSPTKGEGVSVSDTEMQLPSQRKLLPPLWGKVGKGGDY